MNYIYPQEEIDILFKETYEVYINKLNLSFLNFKNISTNHPMILKFCSDYDLTETVINNIGIKPIDILYILLLHPDKIKNQNDYEYSHCINTYLKIKNLFYLSILNNNQQIISLLTKLKYKLIIILKNMYSKILFLINHRIISQLSQYKNLTNEKIIEIINKKYLISISKDIIINFEYDKVEKIQNNLYKLLAYTNKLKDKLNEKNLNKDKYKILKNTLSDYEYYLTRKNKDFRLIGIRDTAKSLQTAFLQFKNQVKINKNENYVNLDYEKIINSTQSEILKTELILNIRDNIDKYYLILSVLKENTIQVNKTKIENFDYEKCKYNWTNNMCDIIEVLINVCYIYGNGLKDNIFNIEDFNTNCYYSFISVYINLKHEEKLTVKDYNYLTVTVKRTINSLLILLNSISKNIEYGNMKIIKDIYSKSVDMIDNNEIKQIYNLIKLIYVNNRNNQIKSNEIDFYKELVSITSEEKTEYLKLNKKDMEN